MVTNTVEVGKMATKSNYVQKVLETVQKRNPRETGLKQRCLDPKLPFQLSIQSIVHAAIKTFHGLLMKKMFSVGTATENTHFLSVSAHGLTLPRQRPNKRSPLNSWIERNRE